MPAVKKVKNYSLIPRIAYMVAKKSQSSEFIERIFNDAVNKGWLNRGLLLSLVRLVNKPEFQDRVLLNTKIPINSRRAVIRRERSLTALDRIAKLPNLDQNLKETVEETRSYRIKSENWRRQLQRRNRRR